MTIALFLLGYAGLLATLGTAALRRAGWTRRAPRTAILAWLALSLSIIGSVLLACLTVAMYATRGGGVSRPCDAPAHWPCAPVDTPAAAVLAGTAVAAMLTVAVRVLWCLCTSYAAAGRERRRQLDTLAVLGRVDVRLGVTFVDHAAPAAYCLPGRHGRIVVTTAALAALDDRQLAAVLAHERAHLRQRHDLMRAAAQALAKAFPHVPAFAAARDEIRHLVELAADDAAAKRSGRLTVAGALLTLAEAAPATSPAAPAPVLTAGGTASAARARRLIAGSRPLGHVRLLLGLAFAAVVVAAPIMIVVAATPAAPGTGCCTTAQPGQSVVPPAR